VASEEQEIKVRETHGVGAPEPFAFRHYPAGPERDCAREFYELWEDLSWLREGELKEHFQNVLLAARAAAMNVAESMVR
jgi:hypothetical protein